MACKIQSLIIINNYNNNMITNSRVLEKNLWKPGPDLGMAQAGPGAYQQNNKCINI